MKRAIKIILDEMQGLIRNEKRISLTKWLIALKNGGAEGQRLLCCLAIDIKHNLINLNKLSNILNRINYRTAIESTGFSHYFESLIQDESGLHFWGEGDSTTDTTNTQYVRIMKLSTFAQRYYNEIDGIDDVKLANDKILDEISNGSLRNVKMPNRGPKPRNCVWVSPLDQINEIIKVSIKNSKNPATEVTNQLGIVVDPRSNIYILIEYPGDFSKVTYQPTTVNANWNTDENLPGLYVSFPSGDNFGRTRARNQDYKNDGIKERVHEGVESNYHYNIVPLGEVDDYNFSIADIGQEALNRLL